MLRINTLGYQDGKVRVHAAQAWQSESDLRSLAKNKRSKQSLQSQPWTSTHALWFTGTHPFPILVNFLI